MYEQSIIKEVKSLSHQLKRMNDENASKNGVTGMQGYIIYLIARRDGQELYQRDLEKELNLRASSITGLLQLMERDGLIRREAVSADARLKRLCLTDKARAVHAGIGAQLGELEKKMRVGLTDDEISSFFKTIHKIHSNLEV